MSQPLDLHGTIFGNSRIIGYMFPEDHINSHRCYFLTPIMLSWNYFKLNFELFIVFFGDRIISNSDFFVSQI